MRLPPFLLLPPSLPLLPPSISFQESDCGVHENLSLQECDELTRNAQMILQMLHLGAYWEVLAVVRNQMVLSKASHCTYDLSMIKYTVWSLLLNSLHDFANSC